MKSVAIFGTMPLMKYAHLETVYLKLLLFTKKDDYLKPYNFEQVNDN